MEAIKYLPMTELEAGLEYIRQSPKDNGVLKMIVRRSREDEREVIERGELDLLRASSVTIGKTAATNIPPMARRNPNAQITVMNSRTIALVAQDDRRWALAGDQLYIDMDLSDDNLPPGTRLAIGSAVIEVSAQPHTGCKKFSSRFGVEAMKFVNSPEGKQLHLRGINAKIVQAGVIRVGDVVRKIQTM